MSDQIPQPTAPMPAASILLLRDGADGLEVLMQQRHQEVGDFAGALTFPGGKVAAGDGSAAVRARADGADGRSDDELAFAASAVRETFEECGVLLARRTRGGPLVNGDQTADAFADRPALDRGELALGDFLAKYDLRLALDRITPWSHWITPAFVPRRYDTWFYLAALPAGQVEDAESRESAEMIWIRPAAAVDAAVAGARSLYLATQLNVLDLARFETVESALDHARAKTIPATVPERAEADGGGHVLRLDAASGYGAWEMSLAEAAGQSPPKCLAGRSVG